MLQIGLCPTVCNVTYHNQALLTFFVPQAQEIPIFGTRAARRWAWAIHVSPAYVGYGMIMHQMTTAHMFLGAIISWAILAPIAKLNGWAPGPIEDWDTGAQGWVIWVALGVILGDSIVGICWMFIHPILRKVGERNPELHNPRLIPFLRGLPHFGARTESGFGTSPPSEGCQHNEQTPLLGSNFGRNISSSTTERAEPKEQTLHGRMIFYWLGGIILLCVITNWYLFGRLLQIWEIMLSIAMIFPLGMASIRSMGETDNALAASLGL